MTATSIGVQSITPKTATSAQSAPQQLENERETVEVSAESKPTTPPPPPLLGKLVDKYV